VIHSYNDYPNIKLFLAPKVKLMESGLSTFRVWIVERNPTEGKNRQYSVRKDINVEDTNVVGVERERRRNLSYGTRKMVIKHDEEMAQNKMKVDKLLW
jgi:hypothetical protein